MSLISRAIPGLFGGVSQAIPAMRHPTQCELQENALSTVVSGLFKRSGSKHVAQLPFTWASGASESLVGNVHCHVVDQGTAGRWQLMLGVSGLSVVNMDTGATELVVYQDAVGAPAAMPAYLTATDPSTAYRTITVADTTFIVNGEKTVASQNLDAGVASTTTGYIYVRTAVPQHTYSVIVNGNTANYTSPATVTVATIVSGLVTAINALPGTGAAASSVNGLILITVGGGLSTLTVTDTFGNSTMVNLRNGVAKFSDLPPTFPTGDRITVTGEDVGADVDPYYIQWNGTQWAEARKYAIQTHLDPSTMPHKVFRQSGTWYVRPIVWDARLVGDDNTNPLPSFVGRKLRDIFFYRNRLGFLAGDSLCMSRAGEYYNFFAKTAREVLDTDPIDIGGSAESVESLDWAVPFNQQLIVWASSKQQFSLVGGDILSPNTARLVPTTAFETVNTARPRPLGNRSAFPSTINGYTQLSLFRVSEDTVSNTAEPLTDHVPTYIPVSPRAIELSETAKTLCVVPPGKGSDLYVFKYEDDGDKLTQKAWQKFIFGGGIIKAHWSGQLLFLTVLYRNATSTGDSVLALEVLDFSPTAADSGLSFLLRLDRKVFVNGAVASGTAGEVLVTATMPDSAGLKVLRYTTGGAPVELQVVSKTVNAGTPTTVTLRCKSPSTTGTFVVGRPYTFRYTFTEVFMRDTEGVPLMDAALKLSRILVRFVKTGYFKAKVLTKSGGSYEYTYGGQGVGLPGQLLGAEPVLQNGDFAIPVHAPADGAVVTLESDSHLPCCFPYAEWRGNLTMKSKR